MAWQETSSQQLTAHALLHVLGPPPEALSVLKVPRAASGAADAARSSWGALRAFPL